MGQAVLDVLYNEKLLVSSTAVGNALISGLKDLLEKHVNLGDIRGLGLFIALEVVADKVGGLAERYPTQTPQRLATPYNTMM